MLYINGQPEPATQTLNDIITIDGLHDVPTTDSADNANMRDVVGNKGDDHLGSSLVSAVHTLEEHIHHSQKVFPTLSDPITLTSAGGAWNLGTIVEVVPVDTITSDFDIHWLAFSSASATDDYEIEIYSGLGGAEVLIASTKTYKQATQAGSAPSPVMTPIQPANTRISAAVASGTGGDDIDISIIYHEY
jgi:hypothetical protein